MNRKKKQLLGFIGLFCLLFNLNAQDDIKVNGINLPCNLADYPMCIPSPTGGTTVNAGSGMNISYEFSTYGVPGDATITSIFTTIELRKPGRQDSTILSSLTAIPSPTINSVPWTVPDYLESGTDYSFMITTFINYRESGGGSQTQSEQEETNGIILKPISTLQKSRESVQFEIIGNYGTTVDLTTPIAEATVLLEENEPVRWYNDTDAGVDILLYKGDVYHSDIDIDAPHTAFSWTPNQEIILPGEDYKVVIHKHGEPTIRDEHGGITIRHNGLINANHFTPATYGNGAKFEMSWYNSYNFNFNNNGNNYNSRIVNVYLIHQSNASNNMLVGDRVNENDLETGTASRKLYDLTIPDNLANGVYAFKIEVDGIPMESDQGDFNLTVQPASIGISKPSHGDLITTGTTVPIEWTSNQGNAPITIQLLKGNSIESTLESGLDVSIGSYSWVVDSDLEKGTDYKIKIISGEYEKTTETFEIKKPDYIKILSPKDEPELYFGTSHTIRWENNIHTNKKVKILLNGKVSDFPGFEETLLIANDISGIYDGESESYSFEWDIPAELDIDDFPSYNISITSENNSTGDITSFFNLKNAIDITAPTTGTEYIKGNDLIIQWTDKSHENTAEIFLNSSMVDLMQLTGGALNHLGGDDWEYVWKIPADFDFIGSDFEIVVMLTGMPNAFDVSPKFTINGSTFELQTPVGNEIMYYGNSYTVSWLNDLGSPVDIELYRDDIKTTLNEANEGTSWSWNVTEDIISGNDYHIRISKSDDPSVFSESGIFTIREPENESEDLNYVLSKSFKYDEEDNQLLISKNIAYADPTGKALQSQSLDIENNQVFATQPIYDEFGRPVISTLPAPIVTNTANTDSEDGLEDAGYNNFQHKKYFITRNGTPYASPDFDNAVDNNQEGTLGWYYSINNTYEPNTAITGFPYSRTQFHDDGSGEVYRSAGAGDQFKIGAGHEGYAKSFTLLQELDGEYLNLRNNEVFKDVTGIEKPETLDHLGTKAVSRDVNGKEAVSFTDLNGNALATALPGSTDVTTVNTTIGGVIEQTYVYEINITDWQLTDLSITDENDQTNNNNIIIIDESDNEIYNGPASALFLSDPLTGKVTFTSGAPFKLNYTKADIIVASTNRGAFLNVIDEEQTPEGDLFYTYEFELVIDYAFDQTLNIESVNSNIFPPGEYPSESKMTYRSSRFRCELIDGPDTYPKCEDERPKYNFSVTYNITKETQFSVLSENITGVDNATNWSKDLHIPQGTDGIIHLSGNMDSNIRVYRLDPENSTKDHEIIYPENEQDQQDCTNASASAFNGTVLNPGFYRIELCERKTDDELTISYDVNYHNYAYNFYDDVGRLVAAISPQGVKQYKDGIPFEQIDKTTYKYNALGWLLEQTETDAGTTHFVYRKDGQIRFSQNAQQKIDGRFSYTSYDWSGRAIESGEYVGTDIKFESHFREGIEICPEHVEITNLDGITKVEANTIETVGNVSVVEGSHVTFQAREMVTLNPGFVAFAGTEFSSIIGECTPAVSIFDNGIIESIDNSTTIGGLTKASCVNVTRTFYDMPHLEEGDDQYSLVMGRRGRTDNMQDFLMGNVAYTEYQANPNETPLSKTWYSYDEEGLVTTVLQYVKGLDAVNTSTDKEFKTLDYTYDFLGNVKEVAFQQEVDEEAFIHQYHYDKNQRLSKVLTGRTRGTLVEQAKYEYYLHGPLKRVEIAEDLQETDFVYTINGWLKSVNVIAVDQDERSNFAPDVFNMQLEYFNGDYQSRNHQVVADNNIGGLSGVTEYFNGNIKAMAWSTQKPGERTITDLPSIFKFGYDDKYQILSADYGHVKDNVFRTDDVADNAFGLSGIIYDLNGNIKRLIRKKENGSNLHNFTYDYSEAGKVNQLTQIAGYASYQYDAIGQLKSEISQEGEESENYGKEKHLLYDVHGKVTSIRDKDLNLLVSFEYSDKGFRQKKINHQTGLETWYVRDVGGSVMAIYEKEYDEETDITTFFQKELPIYGSGRLGAYHNVDMKQALPEWQTRYEAKDHLGNVRAVYARDEDGKEYTTGMETLSVNLSGSPKFENITADNQYRATTAGDKHVYTGEYSVKLNSEDPLDGTGPFIRIPFANMDKVEAEVYVFVEENASVTQQSQSTGNNSFIYSGGQTNTSSEGGNATFGNTTTAPINLQGSGPVQTSVQTYDAYIMLEVFANEYATTATKVESRPITVEDGNVNFNFQKVSITWEDIECAECDETAYVKASIQNNSNTDIWFDDMKVTSTAKILVLSYTDYYPFGGVMRSKLLDENNELTQRYGYQGEFAEKDEETGWNSFELRQYDSNTGRWLSVDPYREFWSPYVGMGNDPMSKVDPDGGCTSCDMAFDAISNFEFAYNMSSSTVLEEVEIIDFNITLEDLVGRIEPFEGFWGNLDFYTGGNYQNGYEYNKEGIPIGVAPIIGYSPVEGAVKGIKLLKAAPSLKLLPSAGKTVKHHIFNVFRGKSSKSQKYRDFFKKHGIDLDAHTIHIPEKLHKLLHKAGNNWTTKWKKWIDANPNAKTKDVYNQAGRMMEEYGVNKYPILPYN